MDRQFWARMVVLTLYIGAFWVASERWLEDVLAWCDAYSPLARAWFMGMTIGLVSLVGSLLCTWVLAAPRPRHDRHEERQA